MREFILRHFSCTLLGYADHSFKAQPACVFNFFGNTSGFFLSHKQFPAIREYEICFWFCIDSFKTQQSGRVQITEAASSKGCFRPDTLVHQYLAKLLENTGREGIVN